MLFHFHAEQFTGHFQLALCVNIVVIVVVDVVVVVIAIASHHMALRIEKFNVHFSFLLFAHCIHFHFNYLIFVPIIKCFSHKIILRFSYNLRCVTYFIHINMPILLLLPSLFYFCHNLFSV